MRIRISRNRMITGVIMLAIVCGFAACIKTTVTTPIVNSSSTIAAIVNNATNLTVLDSILKRTGLINSLNSSKDTQYTLFAPPDVAFAQILLFDSTMYRYTNTYLTRLVQYNLLAGYAKTASIINSTLTGPNSPYTSASGDILYFTSNANGIFVNGNLLTQTDVIAINGVIHAVSNVLVPPNGSIWYTLSNDSTLYNDTTMTYLVAALNKASTSVNTPTSLDSLLSSGVYSLFAPTNNAFIADSITMDAINNTNPDSLVRLLTRHIVAGRVFSSDFTTAKIPTLLANDSIGFAANYSGIYIPQNDGVNLSRISTTNIMATNGVIHKIDEVLVP